jgi:ribonuclease P protein component
VLPSESRMRHRSEFTLAVRRGVRAGRPTMTGHLFMAGPPGAVAGGQPGRTTGQPGVAAGQPDGAAGQPGGPARVGFIVSRAVGSAVVRNRVKRRLRVLVRGYLGVLPAGSLLVVRANPPAAAARQADLAADLDLVMDRLLRRQVGALRQS